MWRPNGEPAYRLRELLGLDALGLFRSRGFATLMIASVLIFIPVSFYFGFTATWMSDIGMDFIPNKISLGQVAEIFFILILPFFITRFGIKRVLFIGIAAWMARFLLFANGDAGSSVWMVYTGILLHGVCYDFFVVTGQIYVDKEAPAHLKSSAQGLITFATYGLGMVIGTWVAGTTIDRMTVDGVAPWDKIWYVPTAIATVILLIFLFLFSEGKRRKAATR
ncbi:MAG: MFS transporter [Bacteroidales bacterium]